MATNKAIFKRLTMKKTRLPTNAVVAVTLNCNSRCVMCDIWKNRITNELKPEEFRKLPTSLRDINITGGEPFLRADLPEIVGILKQTAPKSRLILSTNGFLPRVTEKLTPEILKIDPHFAVRVSLDGWKETHDRIRRIPNGFKIAMESLEILRKAGVKDLGIGFTIMQGNLNDLEKVFEFSKKEGLELSLTLVTNSPIYFGEGKESLRPDNQNEVKKYLNRVIVKRFQSISSKEWFRGWFEEQLLNYYLTHDRPLTCDAAENFFYLDSLGNVFACHIKNWLLGNIRKNTFEEIWKSKRAKTIRENVKKCNDCWMVCTAKTAMRAHLAKIAVEVFGKKMAIL